MIPPVLARLLRLSLFALLAVALGACDSAEPEQERVGITGRWTGLLTSRADSTQAFPVVMTLSDNVSQVTGSGSIEAPEETIEFAVVGGLYSAPSLYLSLVYERGPGSISGNVSSERDLIEASLSGPGVANGEVDFTLSLQRAE